MTTQLQIQVYEKARSELKLSEILRTTKKEQCTGTFHRKGNRYCARGVIMAEKFGWDGSRETENIYNVMFCDWLIEHQEGSSPWPFEISNLNDDGFSFRRIADWLDKEYGL